VRVSSGRVRQPPPYRRAHRGLPPWASVSSIPRGNVKSLTLLRATRRSCGSSATTPRPRHGPRGAYQQLTELNQLRRRPRPCAHCPRHHWVRDPVWQRDGCDDGAGLLGPQRRSSPSNPTSGLVAAAAVKLAQTRPLPSTLHPLSCRARVRGLIEHTPPELARMALVGAGARDSEPLARPRAHATRGEPWSQRLIHHASWASPLSDF